MNRIDRVTAILIQLQSKRIVKAQEIAERFDISLRTVYRDIRALEEAGIPLLGETGIGYSLMEGYRLPPVMFTKEEATAFLTAEKLIEKLTDTITAQSYKSAMYKIKSVLKASEKDFLENMENHIEVIKNPYLPETNNAIHSLQLLLKSIADKRVLIINYFANNSQKQLERTIEPIGIFFLGSHWHLIAYCQLRSDYRDFRVDRISQIASTVCTFKRKHPTLKTYLAQTIKEKEVYTVILTVEKAIVKYFGDQKYYNGFVSQRELGEKVEMTFLTCSLEGFARWYIMFADKADIVAPGQLKVLVSKLITTIYLKVK